MKKQDAAVIKILSDIGYLPEPTLSVEQEDMLERALDPEKEFLYNVQKLFEALFDTSEIVEYIFNETFSKYVNEAVLAIEEKPVNKSNLIITNRHFDVAELKNNIEDSKFQKALKMNPIEISAGVFAVGSVYSPTENNIFVSFNQEIYDMFKRFNYSYTDLLNNVPESLHKNIESEFNGTKIRASIAHEISHWMDDTFNNKHISKMISKVGATGVGADKRQQLLNRNQPDTYMTDYEINAMIHGIAESKRKYADKWDDLTINDLFNIDPSLNTVRSRLKQVSKKRSQQFMRMILQRMNRENLLGKKMTGKIDI